MRLYNALPVPNKDVPLQDIIEFKLSRRDELLTLRLYLDALYQGITISGDGPHAVNAVLASLDRAVYDCLKVAKESNFPFRLMSLDVGMNLAAAAIAGFGAYNAGLPLAGSLAAGAIAGVGVEVGLKHRSATTLQPLKYVSRYHSELF